MLLTWTCLFYVWVLLLLHCTSKRSEYFFCTGCLRAYPELWNSGINFEKRFFYIFFENVVSTPNISLLFIKGETSAILTMNLNKDSKLTRHRLPEECLKSKQQISWHVINLQKQSFKPDTSSLYCRLSVLSYQAETEMILMTSSIVFLQVYWTWCGVFEGSLMVKLLSLCRLYYKEYGIDQFCIDRVMT